MLRIGDVHDLVVPQHRQRGLTRRQPLRGSPWTRLAGTGSGAEWPPGVLAHGADGPARGQLTMGVHVTLSPRPGSTPLRPRALSRRSCFCMPSTMPW